MCNREQLKESNLPQVCCKVMMMADIVVVIDILDGLVAFQLIDLRIGSVWQLLRSGLLMDDFVPLRVCAIVRLKIFAFDQVYPSDHVVRRVCECLVHDLLDGSVLLTSYVPAIIYRKKKSKPSVITSEKKLIVN